MGHKTLYYKDGKLILWKVPMIFNFINTLPFLQKNLGDEFSHILYEMGRIQAVNGTNILIKKFGMKKVEDYRQFLNIFLDQATLVGIGQVEFIKCDGPKIHLIYKGINMPITKAYINKYGEQKYPVCHYFRGLVNGASESLFNKKLITIETECIAQGKSCCIFEVKELDMWNKQDELYKQQAPKNVVDFKDLEKRESITSLLSRK